MTWKRVFTAILAGIFVLAFTAATVQAQRLKVTIRAVPVAAAQKFLKTFPKRFKKDTGIDMDVEIIPSRELRRRLITAAETKTGPDLIQVLYNGAISVKDALEPVDDVVNAYKGKHGGFYDMYKDVAFFDGRWKAAPFMTTSQVLNYRKDILKKLGEKPPDTWEDALRIGIKAKKAGLGRWAESLGTHVIDPSTTVLCILWSYGSRQVSKDGKRITLDSPETRAGLRFLKRAYEQAWPKAVIQWAVLENNQTFLAGKTIMTINSPSIWWKASTKRRWKELYQNIGFVVTPRGPGGRHCTAIPQVLALFKHSKMKKEAKAFMRWILEADMQVEYSEKAWMWTPVYKGLIGRLPDNEYYRVMVDQANYAHVPGWPGPPSRAGAETHERFTLVTMAQRYVQGQDLDATIKQAVKELRKIYGVQ